MALENIFRTENWQVKSSPGGRFVDSCVYSEANPSTTSALKISSVLRHCRSYYLTSCLNGNLRLPKVGVAHTGNYSSQAAEAGGSCSKVSLYYVRFCLKAQNGAWEAAQWIKVLQHKPADPIHCQCPDGGKKTDFSSTVLTSTRYHSCKSERLHECVYTQKKMRYSKKRKVSASLTSYSTIVTLIFLIIISCIVSIKDISNKFTLRINDQHGGAHL